MKAIPIPALLLGLCLLSVAPSIRAQTPAPPTPPAAPPAETPTMSFEEYEPKSTLVVPEHPLTRAKYPFIDVHNHQPASRMTAEESAKLVAAMDGLNMAVMVNLSGGSGENFQKGWAALGRHLGRFAQFANVDFEKISEPGFGENAARQLEADVKNGARGLKVFKNLGMFLKDKDGRRVQTDDPRLDPIWAKCAELGIPVLIHTGEPAASGNRSTASTSVGWSSRSSPTAAATRRSSPLSSRPWASSTTSSGGTRRRSSSTPTSAGWATTSPV